MSEAIARQAAVILFGTLRSSVGSASWSAIAHLSSSRIRLTQVHFSISLYEPLGRFDLLAALDESCACTSSGRTHGYCLFNASPPQHSNLMSEAEHHVTNLEPVEIPGEAKTGKGVSANAGLPQKTNVDAELVAQKHEGDNQLNQGHISVPTQSSPMPIWPFAETNQGLLSLIALMAALAFGLYEYRLNLRAGDVRRREYITMVMGIIDEMLTFTRDIRQRFDAGDPFQMCAGDWRRQIIAPRFSLGAIRTYPPGDALLAIEVNRLWHSLQMEDNIDAAGNHVSRLAEMEANLRSSREVIRARW